MDSWSRYGNIPPSDLSIQWGANLSVGVEDGMGAANGFYFSTRELPNQSFSHPPLINAQHHTELPSEAGESQVDSYGNVWRGGAKGPMPVSSLQASSYVARTGDQLSLTSDLQVESTDNSSLPDAQQSDGQMPVTFPVSEESSFLVKQIGDSESSVRNLLFAESVFTTSLSTRQERSGEHLPSALLSGDPGSKTPAITIDDGDQPQVPDQAEVPTNSAYSRPERQPLAGMIGRGQSNPRREDGPQAQNHQESEEPATRLLGQPERSSPAAVNSQYRTQAKKRSQPETPVLNGNLTKKAKSQGRSEASTGEDRRELSSRPSQTSTPSNTLRQDLPGRERIGTTTPAFDKLLKDFEDVMLPFFGEVSKQSDGQLHRKIHLMIEALKANSCSLTSSNSDDLDALADGCLRTHSIRGGFRILHVGLELRFTSKTLSLAHFHGKRPQDILRKYLQEQHAGIRTTWYNEGIKWMMFIWAGTPFLVVLLLAAGWDTRINEAHRTDIKALGRIVRELLHPRFEEYLLEPIARLAEAYPLRLDILLSKSAIAFSPLSNLTMWHDTWAIDWLLSDLSWTFGGKCPRSPTWDSRMLDLPLTARLGVSNYHALPSVAVDDRASTASPGGRKRYTFPKIVTIATPFDLSRTQRAIKLCDYPEQDHKTFQFIESLRVKGKAARRIDVLDELVAELSYLQVPRYGKFHGQASFLAMSTSETLNGGNMEVTGQDGAPLFSVYTSMPSSIRRGLLGRMNNFLRNRIELVDTHEQAHSQCFASDDDFPTQPMIEITSDRWMQSSPSDSSTDPSDERLAQEFENSFDDVLEWYQQAIVTPPSSGPFPFTKVRIYHSCAPSFVSASAMIIVSDCPVSFMVAQTAFVIQSQSGDVIKLDASVLDILFQHYRGRFAVILLEQ